MSWNGQPGDPPPHQSSGLLPGWQFCFDAGLCQAPPCSWHPVGQQEVHEYEALSGCPGGCLYCWLILFCQSLQTILRIILDITERQGVTERLKAENQLRWVGMMNNIRSAAEEVVLNNLIYA